VQMRSDGYSVERHRLFGLVDLAAVSVGTMLCTTFERSLGVAILWS
jgi:hypothetical protein